MRWRLAAAATAANLSLTNLAGLVVLVCLLINGALFAFPRPLPFVSVYLCFTYFFFFLGAALSRTCGRVNVLSELVLWCERFRYSLLQKTYISPSYYVAGGSGDVF